MTRRDTASSAGAVALANPWAVVPPLGNLDAYITAVNRLPMLTQEEEQRFARELECGGVFLNGYCASDARVAFGGVKKSGFGRELSHFGLHEFCNAQTVWKDRR